jgi:hypothetical protein
MARRAVTAADIEPVIDLALRAMCAPAPVDA